MTKIKQATIKMLKEDYGIDEYITEALFERKILFEPAIRNVLIREEYKRKIQPKEKNRVKSKLAEQYYLSFFSIEKIIANK